MMDGGGAPGGAHHGHYGEDVVSDRLGDDRSPRYLRRDRRTAVHHRRHPVRLVARLGRDGAPRRAATAATARTSSRTASATTARRGTSRASRPSTTTAASTPASTPRPPADVALGDALLPAPPPQVRARPPPLRPRPLGAAGRRARPRRRRRAAQRVAQGRGPPHDLRGGAAAQSLLHAARASPDAASLLNRFQLTLAHKCLRTPYLEKRLIGLSAPPPAARRRRRRRRRPPPRPARAAPLLLTPAPAPAAADDIGDDQPDDPPPRVRRGVHRRRGARAAAAAAGSRASFPSKDGRQLVVARDARPVAAARDGRAHLRRGAARAGGEPLRRTPRLSRDAGRARWRPHRADRRASLDKHEREAADLQTLADLTAHLPPERQAQALLPHQVGPLCRVHEGRPRPPPRHTRRRPVPGGRRRLPHPAKAGPRGALGADGRQLAARRRAARVGGGGARRDSHVDPRRVAPRPVPPALPPPARGGHVDAASPPPLAADPLLLPVEAAAQEGPSETLASALELLAGDHNPPCCSPTSRAVQRARRRALRARAAAASKAKGRRARRRRRRRRRSASTSTSCKSASTSSRSAWCAPLSLTNEHVDALWRRPASTTRAARRSAISRSRWLEHISPFYRRARRRGDAPALRARLRPRFLRRHADGVRIDRVPVQVAQLVGESAARHRQLLLVHREWAAALRDRHALAARPPRRRRRRRPPRRRHAHAAPPLARARPRRRACPSAPRLCRPMHALARQAP